MAKIYAVGNRKGGCAKTTTAGAIASGAGRRGLRVLAVDFDPQGNLTQWNGIDASDEDTIYEALHGDVAISDVILSGAHYDLAPAYDSLSLAETDFITVVGRENKLADALRPIEGEYDLIIIDTPPSLGLLTIMAFTAAKDGILVTSDASAFATQGMNKLADSLESVRQYYNPGARVIGVIIGRVNPQTNIAKIMKDITAKFASEFDAPVYETCVRTSVDILTCQTTSQDLFDSSKLIKAVADYDKLVDEFLSREGFEVHAKDEEGTDGEI